MLIDTHDLPEGSVIAADVCIVGAGVVGIALAHEYLKSHRSVALVESGDVEPGVSAQPLNVGTQIGVRYYKLEESRARGFGGTCGLWHVPLGGSTLGVRLIGLEAIDFERRDWVENSGWPFAKAELDPYYEKAHALCEIGPYAYTVDAWKSVLPAEDLPILPDSRAVDTRIFQFAPKALWLHKYRESLTRAPNITLYVNGTVTRVQSSPSGESVVHLDASTSTGKRIRFLARQYILAAGGIETARLMLLSNDINPQGIGNDRDNVGRYFMEHPHLWSGYLVPSDPGLLERFPLYDLHSVGGTPIMGKLTIRPEIQRKHGLLNFAASIHPRSRQEPLARLRKLKHRLKRSRTGLLGGELTKSLIIAAQHVPDLIQYKYAEWRSRIDHGFRQVLQQPNVFVLNVMSEQAPNRDSRVRLGADRDEFGQQGVELDWRLSAADIDSIRRSQLILGEETRRFGLGEFTVELENDEIPPDIHGGWHHMGTTRMDEDLSKGVVDRNCRVHGMGNLYIAGASVFPTVGYANPVLTSIALAVRLADHLKASSGN